MMATNAREFTANEESSISASVLFSAFSNALTANNGGKTRLKDFVELVDSLRINVLAQRLEQQTYLAEIEDESPRQAAILDRLNEDVERNLMMFTAQLEECSKDANEFLRTCPILADSHLQSLYDRFSLLLTCQKYLELLQRVSNMQSDFEDALSVSDRKTAADILLELRKLSPTIEKSNLATFLYETVAAAEAALTEELRAALIKMLLELPWPLPEENSLAAARLSPAQSDLLKSILNCFAAISEGYAEILHKDEAADKNVSVFPFGDIFVEPFKKRFLFHFYGSKKTNAPDKPEWYFTQMLSWLRLHLRFLAVEVSPLIKKSVRGLRSLGDAEQLVSTFISQFMRSMVKLVKEKLSADVQTMDDNDELFSHLIDETVLFEAQLANLGFPEDEPNCLDILCNEPHLTRWLTLEHACNTQRIEMLLTDNAAWTNRYQDAEDVDDFKVSQCFDDFLALLQLITERYRLIRSPAVRLQFFAVQTELLDDFRVRTLQLHRSAESVWDPKSIHILNGISYISFVLNEWNGLLFYVELMDYRTKRMEADKPRSVNVQGAFDGTIALYDHMRDGLVDGLVDALFSELIVTLQAYAALHWHSMKGQPINVSNTFFRFLLLLRGRLTFLSTSLCESLFVQCYRLILTKLKASLLNDVVLTSQFNVDGAKQLQYDLTTAFLPLLKSYTNRVDVEGVFHELIDSVTLLCLESHYVVLLSDALSFGGLANTNKILADLKIANLNMELVNRIILLRIDRTS